MRKVMGLRRKPWMLVAAVGGLLAVLALLGARPAGPALGQDTMVRVVSPGTASVGETVAVNMNIDDVADLDDYEWELAYDPSILELAGGANPVNGPFLATTGRSVSCQPPILDEGTVRFGCVSAGTPGTGPTGSGLLSTVTFNAKAAGGSSLCLRWASLGNTDLMSNDIPLSPGQYQHSSIVVGGGSPPPACPPAATPTPAAMDTPTGTVTATSTPTPSPTPTPWPTPTPGPFSGIIPARASSVTVDDERVGARIHISVTLTSDPGRSTCWFGRCFAMGAPPALSWVEPLVGQGFVVHLTGPVGRDTTFTYRIQ